MSLLARALIYVAKEIASPILSGIGEHIGDACGKIVAARINPDGEPLRKGDPEEIILEAVIVEPDEEDEEPGDEDDEEDEDGKDEP